MTTSILPSRPTIVRLLRRTHMYAGLFLIPWVLLYGTTAFLFNHPTFFSPRLPGFEPPPTYVIGREILLGPNATADTVARHLLAALAADSAWHGAPVPTLVPNSTDGSVEFTMRRGDTVFNARYDMTSQTLRADPQLAPPPPPLSVTIPAASAAPSTTLLNTWGKQLTQRANGPVPFQADTDTHHPVRASLNFRAAHDTTRWFFNYDWNSGRLTVQPMFGSGTLTPREFFTSLHTTREYPKTFSARTVWAMFVDAMATLMLYWATSGVIMWWQYRTLRRIGALVITGSLLTATTLALSLYHITAGW